MTLSLSRDDHNFEKSKNVLEFLLMDKKNELVDLANAMGISTTTKGWEETVLKACQFFNDYLKYLLYVTPYQSPDDERICKCMTLMRKILGDL